MTRPPIALTCGEPASIAPEITAKAWAAIQADAANCFFLIGDAQDFVERIIQTGLQIPVMQIEDPSQAHEVFGTALPILDLPQPTASPPSGMDTSHI